MACYVEYNSVEDLVKDSEIVNKGEKPRNFQYELNQKQAKAKLIKGAKREAFDIEKKSSSINLIFNLGSWSSIVLPSIQYWNQIKGEGTCKIGSSSIRVVSVKSGTEAGGNHVDTQIVFFINRDKVTCHFYNTTQLILINGHGYSKFVEEFLKPYFLSKITKNMDEINDYNEKALESLSGKKVKRGSVKYKGGSTFPCNRCEFAARTLTSLAKHSRNEHALDSSYNSTFLSPPLPTHSTRNNSLIESDNPLAVEYKSEQDVKNDEIESKGMPSQEKEKLQYTCMDCDYKYTNKIEMDKHVVTVHGQSLKEVDIVCGVCSKKFHEEGDYNIHLKTHKPNVQKMNIICGVCDTVFNKEVDYTVHIQNHELEDKPIQTGNLNIEDVSIEILLNEDNDIRNPTPLDELVKSKHNSIECSKCNFEFISEEDLKSHEEKAHDDNKLPGIQRKNVSISIRQESESTRPEEVHVGEVCPFCKLESKDLVTLKMHIESIHIRAHANPRNQHDDDIVSVNSETCTKCQKCPFVGNKTELRDHMEAKHTVNYTCQDCGNNYFEENELRDHVQVDHVLSKQAEPFPCEVCGVFFLDVNILQRHAETFHKVEMVNCNECKKPFASSDQLQGHMVEEHPEIVMFYNMAQHVLHMYNRFEEFGTSLNAIKQELFLIRNSQNIQVTQPQHTPAPTPRSPAPPSTKAGITQVESGHESVKVSFAEAVKKCKSTESTRQRKPSSQSPASPSLLSGSKSFSSVPEPEVKVVDETPKVLFIGDSVSSCVNFEALENALDRKVISSKAYSSVYDDEHNAAKQAARFPRANFKDVIPTELNKSNYEALILQAGSTDISNLDTKQTSEDNIEYFRHQATLSAKNLFTAAENAFTNQPALRKVVIMKHTPRYDPVSSDPLSLKPALSELFNNVLTEQWMSSALKDKISVGNHNLECSGAIQQSRYRESISGRFDGVHLLGNSGPKFYTLSVINILRNAQLTSSEYEYHQNCPQTQFGYKYQYTNRKSNKSRPYSDRLGSRQYRNTMHTHGYSVPTYNRFQNLQGN